MQTEIVQHSENAVIATFAILFSDADVQAFERNYLAAPPENRAKVRAVLDAYAAIKKGEPVDLKALRLILPPTTPATIDFWQTIESEEAQQTNGGNDNDTTN